MQIPGGDCANMASDLFMRRVTTRIYGRIRFSEVGPGVRSSLHVLGCVPLFMLIIISTFAQTTQQDRASRLMSWNLEIATALSAAPPEARPEAGAYVLEQRLDSEIEKRIDRDYETDRLHAPRSSGIVHVLVTDEVWHDQSSNNVPPSPKGNRIKRHLQKWRLSVHYRRFRSNLAAFIHLSSLLRQSRLLTPSF